LRLLFNRRLTGGDPGDRLEMHNTAWAEYDRPAVLFTSSALKSPGRRYFWHKERQGSIEKAGLPYSYGRSRWSKPADGGESSVEMKEAANRGGGPAAFPPRARAGPYQSAGLASDPTGEQ
jgi:hypothetical protein